MEQIMTREEAIQRGLNRYFTGEPCPHGHIAARRTINRSCVVCNAADAKRRYEKLRVDAEYMRRAQKRAADWAKKHPDHYAQRQRQWREANKDQRSAYGKAWRQRNAERIKHNRERHKQDNPDYHKEYHKRRYTNPTYVAKARARAKAWRKANVARYQELLNKWKAKNPSRYREIQRAGTINRRARLRAIEKLSAEDVKAIRNAKQCAVCGATDGKMEIDHIIAISRGGRNHRSNLQLLCRPCNRAKWAKDMTAWLAERTTS